MTDILDDEMLDNMREAKRLSDGLVEVINARGCPRGDVLANAIGHVLAMHIASPGAKLIVGDDLELARRVMLEIIDRVSEKTLPLWVKTLADEEKTAVH